MKANRQGPKTWVSAALLAAAAAALWLAGRPANAGDAPKGAADELDAVPLDGAAVISFRAADVWDNAAFQGLRERLAKDAPDFTEHFTKETGVAPGDVERVTGVAQALERQQPWAIVVTTSKPYDARKIAATIGSDAKEETVNEHKLEIGADEKGVGFLTDRTFVRGQADEVRRVLKESGKSKNGALAALVREAAGKHLLAVGLDVEALAKTAPAEARGPEEAALQPLLKAKTALLTVDMTNEVKADLRVAFEGESDAKHGEEAINNGLDLLRGALVKQAQEMAKNRELAGVVEMMQDAQAGLRAAKVERNGSEVDVAASAKIDAGKASAALLDGVQKVRIAAARMQSANNLKQLALAMFNYNDTFGRFPAQAIYDKNGKPLLSWRVMILPYVEQQALYAQFHLDEPWDSDNNKKLLEQMPKVFASPVQSDESLKNHETHYQGFVGKGAFFDGPKGVKIADIPDGTSNTIMLVEAKDPVPWTKPDDVPFDQGKLLPKVGGLFHQFFQAAMCDGSVRSVTTSIKEDTLRAAITRNGGEVLGPDW